MEYVDISLTFEVEDRESLRGSQSEMMVVSDVESGVDFDDA